MNIGIEHVRLVAIGVEFTSCFRISVSFTDHIAGVDKWQDVPFQIKASSISHLQKLYVVTPQKDLSTIKVFYLLQNGDMCVQSIHSASSRGNNVLPRGQWANRLAYCKQN